MDWWTTLLDPFREAVEQLRSGGLVMIPLAGVSLLMWLLIFRKVLELRSYKREQLSLGQCVSLVEDEGPEAAPGWHGRMIREFRERRSCDPESDRELLGSLAHRYLSGLEKHVGTIVVLASVAPLLGLLGTVTGMIATFDVIARFGTGNARALASGISEALITTQTGLIVAIPGLFMGHFLSRRIQRFRARMERFCLGFSRECALLGSNGEAEPDELRQGHETENAKEDLAVNLN